MPIWYSSRLLHLKREQNVKGFLADWAQAPVLIRATKSSFENKMKIVRNIFPPEFDISRFLIESTVSSIEKGNIILLIWHKEIYLQMKLALFPNFYNSFFVFASNLHKVVVNMLRVNLVLSYLPWLVNMFTGFICTLVICTLAISLKH